MACTFSGLFYVRNVRDKYLDCVFIDECDESHELSIIHYDNHSGRCGPFPEASQHITSGHVYVLQGIMTIIDKDYLRPSVPFPSPFSCHETYVSIDASNEFLSNVTLYFRQCFSVSDDVSCPSNVSNASHDVSISKNCPANLAIQQQELHRMVS